MSRKHDERPSSGKRRSQAAGPQEQTLASKALWDARDVATFFKASRNWVYQQAELGKIPCVRIGGLLRFDPEKIKALGNGELLPLSRARLK